MRLPRLTLPYVALTLNENLNKDDVVLLANQNRIMDKVDQKQQKVLFQTANERDKVRLRNCTM
ncbi:MAG: hypothetical protein GY928_04415 [Colwellia sp.]|nr:hypothetical protein [Colwellia sp.]